MLCRPMFFQLSGQRTCSDRWSIPDGLQILGQSTRYSLVVVYGLTAQEYFSRHFKSRCFGRGRSASTSGELQKQLPRILDIPARWVRIPSGLQARRSGEICCLNQSSCRNRYNFEPPALFTFDNTLDAGRNISFVVPARLLCIPSW